MKSTSPEPVGHGRTTSKDRPTSRRTVSDTTQIKVYEQKEQAQNQELSIRDIICISLILIFLLAGFILFLVFQDTGLADNLSIVLEWFQKVKWPGLIMLILLYIFSMIFMIPIKSILALVFGLFYGLPFGLFLTYISAVIGILLAFLMGRYVCKQLMERFIYVFCIRRFTSSHESDTEKMKKFDRYVELFNYLCKKEGLKTVLMIRFSFFPPSEWTNYIFANTSVSFKDFALGSAVGRIFATASVYVYIGSTLTNILQIIQGDYPSTFWYSFIISASLYVFFFILLVILTKNARKWLKGRQEQYVAHKKLASMNRLSFYGDDVDQVLHEESIEKARTIDSAENDVYAV